MPRPLLITHGTAAAPNGDYTCVSSMQANYAS
jgi:hypothetical protein